MHVLVNCLTSLFVRRIGFFKKDIEGVGIFFFLASEALLQRALLHLHASFFLKFNLFRVPALYEFEFIFGCPIKLASKVI